MTCVLLRDCNIQPKTELHWSPWVERQSCLGRESGRHTVPGSGLNQGAAGSGCLDCGCDRLVLYRLATEVDCIGLEGVGSIKTQTFTLNW